MSQDQTFSRPRWLRREVVVVGLAIITFTIAVSAVGFWKYAYYRYHGLDLAIFTNTIWNLSHGNGWYSSIQGGSYLGDHVEPILYLLVPFFRLWSDPRLLIVLQALVLGLTAIPIYRLLSSPWSQRAGDARVAVAAGRGSPEGALTTERPGSEGEARGSEGGKAASSPRWGERVVPNGDPRPELPTRQRTLLVALWLLNPLLWNAALFEFHALAFAPVFLLSAAVAFIRRRFWWFLFWIILALLVREDVALIVVMFGAVAVIQWWRDRRLVAVSVARPAWTQSMERAGDTVGVRRGRTRERWWIMAPLVLGFGWFILTTRIAAAAGGGSYAFLIYYGWLGDSFASVITGAFLHPFRVLDHLLALGNLDMAFGLLLPFLFLPFLRPLWLVLALPPLAQVLLSSAGGSNLIIELHYGLLFLPGLALATIDALTVWFAGGHQRLRMWIDRRLPLPPSFGVAIVVGTVIAASVAIGPFRGMGALVVHGASAEDRMRRSAYDDILSRIPSGAPVASSYAALPHIAARGEAVNLGYVYLGVTQFARRPYAIPDTVRFLVMDQRDAVAYSVQFPTVAWAAPHAEGGVDRLRDLVVVQKFTVVAERDGVALLARPGFAGQNFGGEGPRLDARYFRPAQSNLRGGLVVDELRDLRVEAH